jgi:hypothetical protein
MPSIPRGVLRQMAGGRDRLPTDRWSPSETKDSAIRVYQYEVTTEVGGVTTVEKKLCSIRMLHFHGKGKPPTECSGGMACEQCRRAAMTRAQGTPDSEEQARQFDASPCPTFVVIPLDEPTRFRMYDARFAAFQGICLEIAMAGGWRSAKYPEMKAWDEGSEVGPFFDKCVEEGAKRVCGPNGQDLILSPKSKGKGYTWSVRRIQDGNAVLPFPEDSKVLNPEVVQARIKAAMEKKNSMKEGD